MSVLAELRDYERRVIERLNELKPLVDEYQELEKLAERLGLERTPPAAGQSRRSGRTRTRSSTRSAPRRATSRRATPGRKPQRREQVLQLVNQRPGITVPDVAKEIGVDSTGLYRVVRQLQKEGLVSKSGMQLTPGG
jgi:hypothetical protein